MDQATAIKQRAQALIQRGALGEAMAEYEKLLGIEPVNPYAFILIGDLAARMGARADALKRYNEGADAYKSLGLYRNAIAVLKRLLRLEPGQDKNLRRIADVYAKEGLVAEAVAHYLEFVSRRLKDGGGSEAREALDAVCRLGIPNSDVAARVTDFLCEVGDPERATRELIKLAMDLEARGQGERARLLRLRAANVARDAGLEDLADLAPVSEDLGGAGLADSPAASAAGGVSGFETELPEGIPAAGGIGVLPGLERTGGLFSLAASSPPSLEGLLGPSGEETPGEGRRDEAPLAEQPEPEPQPEPEAEAEPVAPEEVEAVEPPDPETLSSELALALGGGEEEALTSGIDPGRPSGDAGGAPMTTEEASSPESPGYGASEQISAEVANIFDRFRAGIAPQLTGDHATHYDLGITYMEMGVFTEAISEFRIAIEGGGYRQRCLELLATCYSRLDRPDLAAAHWRAAIQEAGDSEGEIALRYELACALATAGQVEDARQELNQVLRRDPSFAAARERLDALSS